jgi:hypothetical protein
MRGKQSDYYIDDHPMGGQNNIRQFQAVRYLIDK